MCHKSILKLFKSDKVFKILARMKSVRVLLKEKKISEKIEEKFHEIQFSKNILANYLK